MKNNNNDNKKYKKGAISIALIALILISGMIPTLNKFYHEFNENQANLMSNAYDPSLPNYLYESNVNELLYEFNAKGECYLLVDINGTDFTNLLLDEETYELSYGINIFTMDFGSEFTSHVLTIQQQDIDDDVFKWICVEPLFLKQDNITVNLEQPEIITFKAGGPISILMQPNFSYNWLYLEVDDVVINDIYSTDDYPEIDSAFYSYFIEDGAYIRFDLDTIPKEHTMKIKGNGTIEYKIIVNLDWDEDLVHDVEEVQKELFIEDLDPTTPNIWGFFEKSEEFSTASDFNETREGIFRFYVPENYVGYNYLSLVVFSGFVFDIQIDNDSLTLENVILSSDFGGNGHFHPIKTVSPGYHSIYYQYYANKTTEVSFSLDGREIIIFDKPEFKDTDGDGLKDGEERNSGLDPYNADTDNDGLPDNLDTSPSYSIMLNKENLYQFVFPTNPENNTLLSLSIKTPDMDYSTTSTPRLYRDDLNISIALYMRLLGNQSILRTELANFWKDGESKVDSYCLVDGHDITGVGDAIYDDSDSKLDFRFINGKPSENSYDFDINYAINHPAKDDGIIDLRFDFIWLVTSYDPTTGNSTILHFYEMEEDLVLQALSYREIGDVTYKLASPDSMIENQMLWALTQNPELGTTSDFGVEDDIVGEDSVDFMNLYEQIEQDRINTPILRETLGVENTGIIIPEGDVLNTGWSANPLWEKIDEYPETSDTQEISGDGDSICEFDLSTFNMGEDKLVTKIKLNVLGKIEGSYSLKASWRIGEGSLSDEMNMGLPVQLDPQDPMNNDWAVVEWTGLVLPQSSLEDLRIRFIAEQIAGGCVRVDIVHVEITYQDAGAYLENEVLYVAGLQRNLDVLNKINIQQDVPNPSFEMNHSGDYESYFSYYSVSNVYQSEDIKFLDEALRGENKICYSVTWNNYSYDDIIDYEQRANILGLPIHMELLPFDTSNVLKITQAQGKEIPLINIPASIEMDLHDRTSFWNQTYIETNEFENEIPTINFNDISDIYKEFISDRLWMVSKSKLFFERYCIPLSIEFINACGESFNVLIESYIQDQRNVNLFYDLIDNFINSNYYLGPLSNIDRKSFLWNNWRWRESIIRQLPDDLIDSLVFEFPAIRLEILNMRRDILNRFSTYYEDVVNDLKLRGLFDDVVDDQTKLYLDKLENSRVKLLEYYDYLENNFKEIGHQTDPLDRIRCWLKNKENQLKIKNTAIGATLIGLGTFLTIQASIDLFQLFSRMNEYEGRETEFVFRVLSASCSLAMGVAMGIYGTLLLTQVITQGSSNRIISNINDVAGKALLKFSKVFPKLLSVLGMILDFCDFIADLSYALSIMDENPELATQFIISALLSLGSFSLAILSLAGISTTAVIGVTMCVAIVLIIFITPFIALFIPPPPEETTFPLHIGLEMDYSDDIFKKQGGFEVGNSINFTVGLEHTGSVQTTGGSPRGIKAKFQPRFRYDSTTMDDWGEEMGRWDDRIEIEPYASYGYYFGDSAYPAFWPCDVQNGYISYPDFNYYWPEGKAYTSESYEFESVLSSPSEELTLELKMTKDQYETNNVPNQAGYYYDRSAWVEGEIIPFNLGIPVFENSISGFYSQTTALPELQSLDTLKTRLNLALSQYQFKDAGEYLSQIHQIDPTYECNIPIDTNIARDSKDTIIELDPTTGEISTELKWLLEGNDNPQVDYNFEAPDGFSITPDTILDDQLGNLNSLTIAADVPTQQQAGIYYFNLEVKLHDTGEVIYGEKVPFRIPFVQDLQYVQSNIIYSDSSIYIENQLSSLMPTMNLGIGNIINLKCNTSSDQRVTLDLLNGGITQKSYVVFPEKHVPEGEQFIQIIIDESVIFDQFQFTLDLEDGRCFSAWDFSIMGSTTSNALENVFHFSNQGNIPEFVRLLFSGVPQDYIDQSTCSGVPFGDSQMITLMPGESIDCTFNILPPTESINNLYWRGISAIHPGTGKVYSDYVDSFAIDGIYVDLIYVLSDTSDGYLLDIIPEEPLVWTAYSIDNQTMIEFTEAPIISSLDYDPHYIQVFGRNSLGEEFQSVIRNFTLIDYLIPSSITGLNAIVVSDTQVNLNWDEFVDPGFDHYNIYRDGVKISETTSNYFIDMELYPSNTYIYEVVAVDGFGNEGIKFEQVSVTTTDAIPEKVMGVSSTTISDTNIQINWIANNEIDIDHYNIYRDGVVIDSTMNYYYDDIDLEIGSTYTYEITAIDAIDQEGEKSDVISATTSNAIPEIVTDLSATTISSSQINLAWTANIEADFHHYNIYRDGVKIAESSTNSYSNTGLSASTAYSFQISTVDNADQEGELSDSISATTSTPPPPPPDPFPATPNLFILMIGAFIGICVILNKKIKK